MDSKETEELFQEDIARIRGMLLDKIKRSNLEVINSMKEKLKNIDFNSVDIEKANSIIDFYYRRGYITKKQKYALCIIEAELELIGY
ncbi:MAG: hypothetical protein H0Z24_05680 [Thermosipho sp. (in: Bacteria)]|nr:hypothetical protein [Thermosipho sp. (in: thermotogales)]